MSKNIRDTAGLYLNPARKTPGQITGKGRLRFDQGTLLLEDMASLPEALANYFSYDPRVDAYRAPACFYADIIGPLRRSLYRNHAPRYKRIDLHASLDLEPYPHQREALAAWQAQRGRGLVVLPTGAGKTLVGLLALTWAGRDALIIVPTIDLMHQWYALMHAAFPAQEIGLVGGGYHEVEPLTITTYDSASRHINRLGNRFGMLLFDEVHHLPAEFYRCIAEFSLAPYRLGLTATPERSDGRDAEFPELIGPIIYRKHPDELSGSVLAAFQVRTIPVALSEPEREAYEQAIAERNEFLQQQRISLGSLDGWNHFVMQSAKSTAGRRAMQAHQRARRIAHATPGKLRALAVILANHAQQKTIIFTEDNHTAYDVSQRYLIPCISHQTRVKERQAVLENFHDGTYKAVVTSKVLNEGIDVPDASIGVVLSGSASAREFVQRLGRILRRGENKRAILYEIIASDTREERVSERRQQPLNTRDKQTPTLPQTLPLFDNSD